MRPDTSNQDRAAAQFGRIRDIASPLVDRACTDLQGACDLGFPMVDAGSRHVSLDLARDWSWAVRGHHTAVPAIEMIQAGVESQPEQVYEESDAVPVIEQSLFGFLEAYRSRAQ